MHQIERERNAFYDSLRCGSVCWYNFPDEAPYIGEIDKSRPVVLLNPDPGNLAKKNKSIQVVPLTLRLECNPKEDDVLVRAKFIQRVAIIRHLTTINPAHLCDSEGRLSARDMRRIQYAIQNRFKLAAINPSFLYGRAFSVPPQKRPIGRPYVVIGRLAGRLKTDPIWMMPYDRSGPPDTRIRAFSPERLHGRHLGLIPADDLPVMQRAALHTLGLSMPAMA